MTTGFQASLLDLVADGAGQGPGALGPTVRRTQLAHGAWLDVRRGWVAGADDLFERLHAVVPWWAERRSMYDRVVDVPRLLCFYDEGVALPDPVLLAARSALDALRRRAGRAVPHRRAVPVPGRPRQRLLAR